MENTTITKGKSIIKMPDSFVVFDLETTGLDAKIDEIIEIGAIKVVDNKITETFQQLVKPKQEISNFITNLTGITNEMVSDASSLEEVLPSFLEFIQSYPLIGHNVNFDMSFIYENIKKQNLDFIANNYIDTLRLSRILLRNLYHHRLGDLAEYYHIDRSGAHRSLKDVEMTLDIFYKMEEEAINRYGSIEKFEQEYENDGNRRSIQIIPTKTEFDETNPFYKKNVAITGTLEKMTRREAMQIIVDFGGVCYDSVNANINYLILSNKSYLDGKNGKKSTKYLRAEKLKKEGYDIEILSENVFYELIEQEKISNH